MKITQRDRQRRDAQLRHLAEMMRTALHEDCPPDGQHCSLGDLIATNEALRDELSQVARHTMVALATELKFGLIEGFTLDDLTAAITLLSIMLNEAVTGDFDLDAMVRNALGDDGSGNDAGTKVTMTA